MPSEHLKLTHSPWARYYPLVWLLWLSLIVIVFLVNPKPVIETDILKLLPVTQQNPNIEKALQQFQTGHDRKTIWLIGSDTPDEAYSAAEPLTQQLQESGLFSQLTLRWDTSTQASSYEKLLPYRYLFLTGKDKKSLDADPDIFLQDRLQALYSPLAMQRLASLAHDPLFTYGEYLSSLQPDLELTLFNDAALFRAEGKSWILVVADINQESFGIENQKALVTLIKKLKQPGHPDKPENTIELLYTGLPIYSAYGSASAEKEITSVGVASIVLIVIMFLWVFASARPLGLSMFSIFFGVISAFIITTAIFKQIHVITLVFGTSLIGVSVDYSLHYLCDSFNREPEWNPKKALKNIFPGISLGMASSVLTYSALAFTPFPGLQQIAVFAAIGLFASWLCVCTLFPLLMSGYSIKKTLPFKPLYDIYLVSWPSLFHRFRTPIILLAVVFSVTGISLITASDDIRNMQAIDTTLRQQESKIKQILTNKADLQFFVVEGKSVEEIILRERTLVDLLDMAVTHKHLSSFQALSQVFPTQREQEENSTLVKTRLVDSQLLNHFLQNLHVQKKTIDAIHEDFSQLSSNKLELTSWVNAAPPEWQSLWLGCENHNCASIVKLQGIKNLDYLRKMQNKTVGINFVDRAETLSHLMKEYRIKAIFYVGIAIVGIGILLSLILGISSALWILSIPVSAITLTAASLSFISGSYSLFNVFALLLVLGIGLDYAIFHHISKTHKETTSLAVGLSLLTSLFAFGLLSLSETHVVHAFGLTLALGISFAFILSPLIPVRSTEASNEY